MTCLWAYVLSCYGALQCERSSVGHTLGAPQTAITKLSRDGDAAGRHRFNRRVKHPGPAAHSKTLRWQERGNEAQVSSHRLPPHVRLLRFLRAASEANSGIRANPRRLAPSDSAANLPAWRRASTLASFSRPRAGRELRSGLHPSIRLQRPICR